MCMGPPLCRYNAGKAYWVYPHVYGATMAGYPAPRTALGLSPCVWGHPLPAATLHVVTAPIPMRVGPPRAPYCAQSTGGGYHENDRATLREKTRALIEQDRYP